MVSQAPARGASVAGRFPEPALAPHCCFPSGGPGPAQPPPAPGRPSEPPARPWAPAAVRDTHAPRNVSPGWGRPGTFSAKGAGQPRPGGTTGIPVSQGTRECRAPWAHRSCPGTKVYTSVGVPPPGRARPAEGSQARRLLMAPTPGAQCVCPRGPSYPHGPHTQCRDRLLVWGNGLRQLPWAHLLAARQGERAPKIHFQVPRRERERPSPDRSSPDRWGVPAVLGATRPSTRIDLAGFQQLRTTPTGDL